MFITTVISISNGRKAMLVERYGKGYNLKVNNATYINDVDAEIWKIIKETHSLVDTLLAIDRNLRNLK